LKNEFQDFFKLLISTAIILKAKYIGLRSINQGQVKVGEELEPDFNVKVKIKTIEELKLEFNVKVKYI